MVIYKKAKRDLLIYVAFLMISIILWLAIPYAVPMKTEGLSMVNSRFFPRIIAIAMAIVSFIGMISELINLGKTPTTDEVFVAPTKESGPGKLVIVRVLLLIALMFVYAIALEILGFALSTTIVILLVLFALGERKPLYFLVVLGVCAAIYLVFTYLLKVRLP